MYDFSLIITCFNEELYLEENLAKIKTFLDNTKLFYELIIIDDKSRDSTPVIIKDFCDKNSRLNSSYILHEINLGRGASVMEGIQKARANAVGFLDIDLEISEDYLLKAYQKINAGFDLVIGQRHYNMNFHPKCILRYFVSVTYRLLVNQYLGLPGFDTESGFKFFNKSKISAVLPVLKETGWFWDTEIVARCYEKNLKIFKLPCLFLRNTVKVSSVKLGTDIPYYIRKLRSFKKELYAE